MIVLAAAVARTITPERQTRSRRTGPPPPTARNPHTSYDISPAAPALPLRAGKGFLNLTMPEPYTPTLRSGAGENRCL